MKHLFYIHSNITYLLSKAIIQYHEIIDKDIVIIKNRGVILSIDDMNKYPVYSISDLPSLDNHINFLKSWSKLIQYEEFIRKAVNNEKYFIYVPLTMLRGIQILINNRNCEGFSIMEEGTDSYLLQDKLLEQHPTRKIKITEKIGYLGKVKNNYYIQGDYKNVYGISKKSFPDYKRKITLNNVFDFNSSYSNHSYDHILILDAVSVYGDIKLEDHLYSIEKTMRYLMDRKIKKIFYKYHPAQFGTIEIDRFEKLFFKFKDQISLVKIPNDIIIEELLINNKKITFYVNVSSLGMYAKEFGHNVYSFANFIIEKCPAYKKIFEIYPEYYIDNIQYLNMDDNIGINNSN